MTDAPLDSPAPQPQQHPQTRQWSSDPMDPRRCVVLVPFPTHITLQCQVALEELQRRGYDVWRVGGYAAIDQGRNQMATDALAAGYEETFWIDSDIDFHPDAVDRLRSHNLPIVSGIYRPQGRAGDRQPDFARHGEIAWASAAGWSRSSTPPPASCSSAARSTRRSRSGYALPTCNEHFGRPMIPFFQPMVHNSRAGPWYLAEDYAFCERARQCGFKIMADTSIRLWHIGEYSYGWEDAGLERPGMIRSCS